MSSNSPGFFQSPLIQNVPNPEPYGFNMLRYMQMMNMFQQQQNPWGMTPYGGGSNPLNPYGGNGYFNPYSGGMQQSPYGGGYGGYGGYNGGFGGGGFGYGGGQGFYNNGYGGGGGYGGYQPQQDWFNQAPNGWGGGYQGMPGGSGGGWNQYMPPSPWGTIAGQGSPQNTYQQNMQPQQMAGPQMPQQGGQNAPPSNQGSGGLAQWYMNNYGSLPSNSGQQMMPGPIPNESPNQSGQQMTQNTGNNQAAAPPPGNTNTLANGTAAQQWMHNQGPQMPPAQPPGPQPGVYNQGMPAPDPMAVHDGEPSMNPPIATPDNPGQAAGQPMPKPSSGRQLPGGTYDGTAYSGLIDRQYDGGGLSPAILSMFQQAMSRMPRGGLPGATPKPPARPSLLRK